jgi:hypothetical protein
MVEKSIKLGKIYSLFYVILVGAIGSGLWDLFLKDLLYSAGGLFVNIASSIYDGYFDHLYRDVGKKIDLLLYFPGIALISLAIISPLVMYFYVSIGFSRLEIALDDDDDDAELGKFSKFLIDQLENHRLRFILILVIPFFIFSISILDLYISSLSSTGAVRAIERRVEIIRPYISDIEKHKIISGFRLVDNRVKLQELVKKIDQVADKNNISLPEISLYGIESSNKRANASSRLLLGR